MVELKLRVAEALVEWLDEALEALDAVSVSVEDADAETPAEQALFGEPGMPPPKGAWASSLVSALFVDEAAAQDACRILLAQPDFADHGEVLAIQTVAEQDWVRITQAQFDPIPITPDFWVVPTWHEPPAQARHVLRLDPGLAFGTGTHPTTRMCLHWIASQSSWAGRRVLDYGCGSGILAMGAARMGAQRVDAVDIDPAAVSATTANAQANGLVLTVGFPDQARGWYDLVVANILATPLKLLAPLLCGHLAPGGQLLLAGILARQADELKQAYASSLPGGLFVLDTQDGWVLMGGAAPTAPVVGEV